ncbi:MAG: hypothetical protein J5554_14175 [Paludibacteraceae bacterium]|nr:hypothetical protein [Paludibacteraceae bacterium]
MKPFVITQNANAARVSVELLSPFLLMLLLSGISIWVKVWIGLVALAILAASIWAPRSKLKGEKSDSIFLKIDEQGITTQNYFDKSLRFSQWQDIKNVEVELSDYSAVMSVYRKDGLSSSVTMDLMKLSSHGLFTYYIFRHKLRSFADDKKKIKCPLTTSGLI